MQNVRKDAKAKARRLLPSALWRERDPNPGLRDHEGKRKWSRFMTTAFALAILLISMTLICLWAAAGAWAQTQKVKIAVSSRGG
ncbi:MAG TPA: hypothetical protein VLJ79_16045 [Candidatus Binatia bacterium]|nr:hypothetical protein [Candidatus Binatia bacterium]